MFRCLAIGVTRWRAIRSLGQAVAKSPLKQSIDRAVMQWMQYRINSKMPGLTMPPVDDLLKGSAMLEENIDKWRANRLTAWRYKPFH
ncbi:MAG: hypothetical protein AUJ20_02705 [Comamonadaceae bacterium CG1_02_60_18]|nr:MAG: hypothetical protein AUJ20_02705 [Comamonadaceae bacterium CG1_02_60_18]PIQ52975.1 MAG: hypothetical protein COW02_07725 [Comamonadaceae bacterium CG12_big_fil_rev_8_21_14_0_65_59_15]